MAGGGVVGEGVVVTGIGVMVVLVVIGSVVGVVVDGGGASYQDNKYH